MKQKSLLLFILTTSISMAIPIDDKVTQLEHALEKIDIQLMEKLEQIEAEYTKLDKKIADLESETHSIETASQPAPLKEEAAPGSSPASQPAESTEQISIPTPPLSLEQETTQEGSKDGLLEEIKQKPKLKPIEATSVPRVTTTKSKEQEELEKRRKAMFGDEEEEDIILKPAPSKEETAPSSSPAIHPTEPAEQTGVPTPPLSPQKEVTQDKSKEGERVDLLEQIKSGTKLKPVNKEEKETSDVGLGVLLEDMYLGEMTIEQLNAELEKVAKEAKRANLRRKKALKTREENINFVIGLKKMSLDELDKALTQEAFNTNKGQAAKRTSWIEQVIKEKGGILEDLEENNSEWD